MKGIGAILVLITGLCLGLMARRTLARRITALTTLERLLQRLAEQIRYTACPIGDVLRTLSETSEFAEYALLHDTVERLSGDGEFRVAWQEAVEQQRRSLSLSERETVLLRNFADGLGTADVAGEVRHCEQYACRIRECIEERKAEAHTRGGLYTVLGFCGGSAAALLLL